MVGWSEEGEGWQSREESDVGKEEKKVSSVPNTCWMSAKPNTDSVWGVKGTGGGGAGSGAQEAWEGREVLVYGTVWSLQVCDSKNNSYPCLWNCYWNSYLEVLLLETTITFERTVHSP